MYERGMVGIEDVNTFEVPSCLIEVYAAVEE